jgi:Spy/CpxP family protein refolding chaperone
MKTGSHLALALTLLLCPAAALAQHHGEAHRATPYAGLQDRGITSLSAADVEELRRGGGWGLALPAEINGAPGPAHLLELKDELGLAPAQVEAIERSFAEMQADAVTAGERLIGAEAALDAAFVAGDLDDTRLRDLIGEAEAARAELRLIHLSRHLSTPALLTADQIARYQVLRGYASE